MKGWFTYKRIIFSSSTDYRLFDANMKSFRIDLRA